jgi:hypothetical protein
VSLFLGDRSRKSHEERLALEALIHAAQGVTKAIGSDSEGLTRAVDKVTAVQLAREVGANGVIIDGSETIISGIISRGVSVKARAIHMAAPVAQVPAGSADANAGALRQLQKLHDDHVITDREYEQKKAEILRRM